MGWLDRSDITVPQKIGVRHRFTVKGALNSELLPPPLPIPQKPRRTCDVSGVVGVYGWWSLTIRQYACWLTSYSIKAKSHCAMCWMISYGNIVWLFVHVVSITHMIIVIIYLHIKYAKVKRRKITLVQIQFLDKLKVYTDELWR